MALPMSPRAWSAAMALACFAAVGAALVAQHGFDMRPCPWCILQRLAFVVIGVLAGLAAVWPAVRRVFAGAAALLALVGIAAGLYQHFIAAKSASCNLTLADKIVNATRLDTALPNVFGVTGSCADAAVSVLGVPFEFWSVALFALLAAAALRVAAR